MNQQTISFATCFHSVNADYLYEMQLVFIEESELCYKDMEDSSKGQAPRKDHQASSVKSILKPTD
jgi:hypothetical protein